MIATALLVAVVFLLAVLVWFSANQKLARSGIPEGRIVSQDAGRRHKVHRPLVSLRYGLVGKPDYLIETRDGFVPVEIKSRNSPRAGPSDNDLAQLTASCVLVEDVVGSVPPQGIIQHADRCWRIKYTPQAARDVLQIVNEIRESQQSDSIHRSHKQPSRCRACGFKNVCEESIAF